MSLELTINNSPLIELGNDIEICNGAVQILDAGTHSSYLWSTGETTQTIDITTSEVRAMCSSNISKNKINIYIKMRVLIGTSLIGISII